MPATIVIVNPTGSTTANIEPGPISNSILASITSPQSSLNGTSNLSGSTLGNSIGAGTGSGTLIQSASPVIGDSRVALFNGSFSLSGSAGTSGVSLSQSGATSTLTIVGSSAKLPERNSALPVYEACNSEARFSSPGCRRSWQLAVCDAGGRPRPRRSTSVEPTGPAAWHHRSAERSSRSSTGDGHPRLDPARSPAACRCSGHGQQ